jgi:hypothetical protein
MAKWLSSDSYVVSETADKQHTISGQMGRFKTRNALQYKFIARNCELSCWHMHFGTVMFSS